jgi:integrase/recombinase XerD
VIDFRPLGGLRWVDIKQLCWKNIQNNVLHVVQSKTQCSVTIPLTEEAIKLLGEPGMPDDKVFNIKSHNTTLKWLKKWAHSAGIKKHVTYHTARYSFVTSLIINNANIAVVSKIAGHHSISMTERYLSINDSQKKEALDKLPLLNI